MSGLDGQPQVPFPRSSPSVLRVNDLEALRRTRSQFPAKALWNPWSLIRLWAAWSRESLIVS
jgi:hypothetical protein